MNLNKYGATLTNRIYRRFSLTVHKQIKLFFFRSLFYETNPALGNSSNSSMTKDLHIIVV